MSSFLSRAALAAALCTPTLAVAQDASGGDAATAPTATDAKTRAFLEEAADAMYQPARHGLESLSFDFVIPGPMGPLATVHCSWTKDGDVEVSKELDLSGIPEPQRPMVEAQAAQFDQQGYQFMSLQLNNVLQNNLEQKVATLRGVEDGLIAVEWTPKPGAQLPPVEETFYFDADDYLWVRAKTSLSAQGQSMTSTEKFSWDPVAGTDEYAQTKIESSADTMMGTFDSTLALERADMHGFDLVESVRVSLSMPPGQPPQTFEFTNLVVNGKPYPSTDG